MISIVFSYLAQSSQTPELKQLRFYNYLLPCLLTVGFIFYFTFDQITQKAKNQRSIAWIRTTVIGLAAIGAIPWQIEHLKWQLQKESFAYFELGTYLIGAIFTIGTIIGELKIIKNGMKNRSFHPRSSDRPANGN